MESFSALLGLDAYASDEEREDEKREQLHGNATAVSVPDVKVAPPVVEPRRLESVRAPGASAANDASASLFGAYANETVDSEETHSPPVFHPAPSISLPKPAQEKSLSYSDIVSRLGLLDELNTISKRSGDVLYDSDDEELADMQRRHDSSMVTQAVQQNGSSAVQQTLDLSEQPEKQFLKRKRVDLQELQEQLLLHEPETKRQRVTAPQLPDFLVSSTQKKKIEIIDEDSEEDDDDSEEFELDMNAYEPLPQEVPAPRPTPMSTTHTEARQTTTTTIEDIDDMNLPDHIKSELRSRQVKEITVDDLKEERELSRQQRLREYHQSSIAERELESAKHRIQSAAGHLMGHEMMKLAQESITLDITRSGGKKKKRR